MTWRVYKEVGVNSLAIWMERKLVLTVRPSGWKGSWCYWPGLLGGKEVGVTGLAFWVERKLVLGLLGGKEVGVNCLAFWVERKLVLTAWPSGWKGSWC